MEHRAEHEQALQMQGDRARQRTRPMSTHNGETWFRSYRRGI